MMTMKSKSKPKRTGRQGVFLLVLLGLLAIPAVVGAQKQSDEEEAREHYNQAEMYMKAGVYDLAITEYRKGYKLTPNAHGFLFNIGLAYEKMGDKTKAVESFEQYLEKEPKGKKAAEARARAVALRRAMESEQKAGDDKGRPDRGDASNKPPGEDGGKKPDKRVADGSQIDLRPSNDGFEERPISDTPAKGRSWTLITVGVAFIAAGLVADLSPDSGTNGKVDAVDFLPVGLYGLGALLLYRGVF